MGLMLKKTILLSFFVFCLCSPLNAQIYTHGFIHRSVALTFDDGPSPLFTEMILDILNQNHIKATFFLVGNKVAKDPELAAKIADDGHELGNHTYFHSRLNLVSNKTLINELKLTSDIIFEKTGQVVSLFRPPHGFLPRNKVKLIENNGYDVILYSVNADDFYHNRTGMNSPSQIASRVISRTMGADIILMHDDSAQTVVALPKIIKALKGRGFNFVTVSKLIAHL
jgi:peptidoglycan-N-acetylglucosamine deacetylase